MGHLLDSSNFGYCGFWSCSCSSGKVGNDGSSFANTWTNVRINSDAELIFMCVSAWLKIYLHSDDKINTFWFQAGLYLRSRINSNLKIKIF